MEIKKMKNELCIDGVVTEISETSLKITHLSDIVIDNEIVDKDIYQFEILKTDKIQIDIGVTIRVIGQIKQLFNKGKSRVVIIPNDIEILEK